jgi:hypothetical protein
VRATTSHLHLPACNATEASAADGSKDHACLSICSRTSSIYPSAQNPCQAPLERPQRQRCHRCDATAMRAARTLSVNPSAKNPVGLECPQGQRCIAMRATRRHLSVYLAVHQPPSVPQQSLSKQCAGTTAPTASPPVSRYITLRVRPGNRQKKCTVSCVTTATRCRPTLLRLPVCPSARLPPSASTPADVTRKQDRTSTLVSSGSRDRCRRPSSVACARHQAVLSVCLSVCLHSLHSLIHRLRPSPGSRRCSTCRKETSRIGPNRDQESYSSCQVGPRVSYSCLDFGTRGRPWRGCQGQDDKAIASQRRRTDQQTHAHRPKTTIASGARRCAAHHVKRCQLPTVRFRDAPAGSLGCLSDSG